MTEDPMRASIALLLPDAGPPEARRTAAARAQLVTTAAAVPPRRGRRRRAATRRPVVAGLGVAVAAVLVALAVVFTGAGVTPSAEARARTVLLQAGASAGRATPLRPRPDQYVYIRDHRGGTHMTPRPHSDPSPREFVAVEWTDEQWSPADPTRDTGFRRTDPNPGADPNRQGLEVRAPKPDFWPDGMDPTWTYLQTLVGNPDRLYDRFAAGAYQPPTVNTPEPQSPEDLHYRMFEGVGHLMGEGGPQLDSDLYEVAARIPGVRIIDGLVDLDGRRGTGVTLTYQQSRADLVFDPMSGQALGTRTVALDGNALYKSGLVTDGTSKTVRVVDAIGQTR